MRTCSKYLRISTLFFTLLFLSCSSDDDGGSGNPGDGDPTEVNSTTYNLNEVAASGVSGTARFVELSDGSVTIELDLNGTPADGQHPAHIHFNTAAEGGGIAVTLGTVDGSTGESTINVTTFDDGSALSYADLIDYNGYINVHLSSEELSTIVAQGDIGQNVLTGESVSYTLAEVEGSGVSGEVTFEERVNGTALATIMLSGTPEGGMHPAHIHANDVIEGGGILVSFNMVDGDSGMSKTQISQFDDGSPLGYQDIQGLDAHVNVHLSAEQLAVVVAQGNIGVN
ncbi:CHRD domain-containing protein [Robertkochia sediminum]|uniref:CHRD domain-containing protein n=1 Tax=Robertkochia sediminum TaxID=2785326 RepID=UPI0019322B76|nr:CHRD domain-containing protein [Robertkochia sediminum]MBL7473872.1 CHRD domain-containing protein [Robertkochia sediminum]